MAADPRNRSPTGARVARRSRAWPGARIACPVWSPRAAPSRMRPVEEPNCTPDRERIGLAKRSATAWASVRLWTSGDALEKGRAEGPGWRSGVGCSGGSRSVLRGPRCRSRIDRLGEFAAVIVDTTGDEQSPGRCGSLRVALDELSSLNRRWRRSTARSGRLPGPLAGRGRARPPAATG